MDKRHLINHPLTLKIIFCFFLTILSCGNSAVNKNVQITGYDLTSPDKVLFLPPILHEISGLTEIDSTSVACIQDENGILFIYDVIKNEIKHQYIFHSDGDYEGITRVGDLFYVLRSDGVLFEISDYQAGKPKVVSYSTGIPAKDNEGLCYDQKNDRLLIACKGKIDLGRVDRDKRMVYGFDLKSKTLTTEPIIIFDLTVIKQFIVNNKIALPLKGKKKSGMNESDLKFRISAIGIHPLTRKLFALSATDYILFIFDLNGTIEQMEKLNPVLFNKPEGITFFKNGEMLISNEGQNGKPTVLRFNHK